MRHIRSDKRLQDWKVTGKKQIVKCAVNQRQVVIALTGGELVYFEMDAVSVLYICIHAVMHKELINVVTMSIVLCMCKISNTHNINGTHG